MIDFRKDIKWIILIFLVSVILLFRLFYDTRLYGHDTLFHTSNIIYLSKTISLNNIFGDNIIYNDIFKFGYGTWLFYPKLPHLLASYFYLITKNVYLSMNIIYFIVMFLSGIFMFYLSKKIFNSNRVSFLSSIIYLSFSYHICDIYTRDAFAESFIFMVIPFVFLGLFELKDNNVDKFYIFFTLGYIIGIYSHLVSMVFCSIFVFIFIVFFRKDLLKKNKIKHFLISAVIVTLISLPFLSTILEHRFFGNYAVFTDTFSSKESTINGIIPFSKYFINNKNTIYNHILVYINYSVIFLIILTIIKYCIKKYKNDYYQERKFLFYFLCICIAFINSKWLWKYLPSFFSMIQFPWRVMVFFSLFISLYASLLFLNFKNNTIVKVIYIIFCFLVVIEGVNNIYYFGKKSFSYDDITNSYGFMGFQKEYLPVSTKKYLFLLQYFPNEVDNNEYDVIIKDGKANLEILEDNNYYFKFRVDDINDNVCIALPRVYYLGYYLFDEKGNKYKLYQSDYGMIQVNLKNNGIYTLLYKSSLYDRIARYIRLFTFIFIICYGGIYLWKKKRL